MAALTSVILIKRFIYRDNPNEEYSNRYYLRNTPPSDSASWNLLITDLIGHEKAFVPTNHHYVRAYGYNDDAENAQAVHLKDFTADGDEIAGIYTPIGFTGSGDQAACLEWKTDRKNSRGKWIYLRKYFHSPDIENNQHDTLQPGYVTLLEAFGNELAPNGGAFYGGIRSRTHADNIVSVSAIPWSTTRTLKRRGKRPLANP